MINPSQFRWQRVAFTASATAGTRTNVAHGLSRGPAVANCWAVATASDEDHATNGLAIVSVVSATATNVVIRSTVASQAGWLYIWLPDVEPERIPSVTV